MRRRPTLLATILFVALSMLVVFANHSLVVSFFNSESTNTSNSLVYPDLETLDAEFEAAKADRHGRIRRLLEGIDSVDDAMERLADHDFIAGASLKPVSGWIMNTESGAQFQRATLQRQTRIFASVGPDAVPHLFKWLENDQMEIRYIASCALEQITGRNSHFPHFATLEELKEYGWLAETRGEYQNWMANRR